MLSLLLRRTQQNSQQWYLLGKTSRRFLWCWLLLLLFFLTGGFSFHCFWTSSLTLPWAIAGFLHPFYTFIPAHGRVIRATFILTFLGFSFLPRVPRFWAGFFNRRRFLPYTPSLVTQMRAETPHPGSFSVPAPTELSLPADAWPWTTDFWIIRPLVYQLRLWATNYEVKFELVNMFRLLKVIWKDYKKNFEQDLMYCLKLLQLHIEVISKKQPPEKKPGLI